MPFEQRRLERRRNNEPLDVVGSLVGIVSTAVVFGTDCFFDCWPSRAQIGFTICRNRSHGFFSLVRRRADADLGRPGDLVQPLASRIKQEWAALFLCRITPNADSVRHSLQSLVKTN